MNARLVLKILGVIILIEAAFMILPLIVAIICHEPDWIWFLITMIGCIIVGLGLYLPKVKKKGLHSAEGFLVVALSWVILSAISAVPFVVGGYIPNFLDAMFETVSGFTTTGSTIVDDIEVFSNSMVFWRALIQWVGGMGIIVFMMAISPVAGGGSAIHLLRAESPGPVTEKISPKISTTAKYLYLIYIGITVLEIICLTIARLSVFRATLVSFCTMATGGFSYMNTSLATLTMTQQTIVTIFMFLAGVNFSLFFLALSGKPLQAIKNEELRWYIGIFLVCLAAFSLNTYFSGTFGSFREALHVSAFMVASVITTTGFSISDVNLWPMFSKTLIMVIMFIGACAGSTAGGLKISRVTIGIKNVKNNLRSLMHPRSVYVIRYNGKEISDSLIRNISYYLGLFVLLFGASMLIVSFDPMSDFETAFSAVNTTINNNGIGLGASGGSFSGFQWYSKVVFILDMLIGRLEIFPIMVLFGIIFSPATKLYRGVRKSIRSRNL